MKNLFTAIAILVSCACFAQYNHNIELNDGNVQSDSTAEIDSITFSNTGAPALVLHLLDGGTLSFGLELINQVTFSEVTMEEPPYPEGTVHCLPEGQATAVVEVVNPATGKIWMDRNLGASQVAAASNDPASYGDLYQWGRFSDGHQCRTSPTTSTLSSSDMPGHGSFILIASTPSDWRSPQNSNLWQGVNGINNPCPQGYRIPTKPEWNEERQNWSSANSAGAFASPLKLPVAGYRFGNDGSLFFVGSIGYYSSSTVAGAVSSRLSFNSSIAGMDDNHRSFGYSVRCIKN